MIETISCFGIAVSHGHNAMEHLYMAVERERFNNECRKQLKANNLDVNAAAKLMSGEKQIFKHLSSSVILFQATMEAIINYSLDEYKQELSSVSATKFADKWIDSLNAVSKETNNFKIYLNSIYRPIRNGLVHPEEKKLSKLKNMTLPVVHTGIKSGWLAYNSLFEGLGNPHTHGRDDKNSWETLCKLHKIPTSIDDTNNT